MPGRRQMNPTEPQPKPEVICRCSGTTTAQIQRQIDQGVTDLDAISQATGVCSGCGGCEAEVLAFLAGCVGGAG
ncbi:(2Fe-2S)-binding protein [Methylomagnum ishizawai]|uniref:(2Fe-2S)-binding protein n=1 Tax=Methylomagnum ishizawai TaxID=1760988 RepID=UPI001C32FA17|nr:(2Fe-2S)-binding protein [Methylomagnum ishizawai]BBL74934.1 hypothetical protein MishRS11D_20320 [Methylomagnum ishizawai]